MRKLLSFLSMVIIILIFKSFIGEIDIILSYITKNDFIKAIVLLIIIVILVLSVVHLINPMNKN